VPLSPVTWTGIFPLAVSSANSLAFNTAAEFPIRIYGGIV